jgi:hypothetical protein
MGGAVAAAGQLRGAERLTLDLSFLLASNIQCGA